MKKPYKTYFNWSSGKDAALALYRLQQDKTYRIEKLLTSINAHHDRVSMHGLRRSLLIKQIEAVGIPYVTVELPEQPSMTQYEQELHRVVKNLKDEGFTHSAFGDIFLEDLREYREKQLAEQGISCVFPLWKQQTDKLLTEMLDLGFRMVIISLRADLLSPDFLGKEIDRDFVASLPENVDPCGENGEFHTFCFDGPVFSKPVPFRVGEKVHRTYRQNDREMGFWFCDLISDD